jgi:pimeloyl-ACP methyl ester carboxylesterase
LIVWGENDRFLPIQHAHAYARGIQGAQLRTIASCGHMVPFEQTDQFVESVAAFLDGPE